MDEQKLMDDETTACEALSALDDEIQERKSAIDAEYQERRNASNSAVYKARTALQEFRDAERLAAAKPPYPVGTVLAEWEIIRYPVTATRTVQPNGVVGSVEIITRDSVHPENLSKWSRANVGDCVIRLYKKDGKPRSRYISPSNWCDDWKMWRPVGVDLNAEIHAAEIAEKNAEREKLQAAVTEVFGL